MASRAHMSTAEAQRQAAGFAEDALSWTDFGAVMTELLGGVIPCDAAVISMIDPATGLLTNIVRSGIDDSQDELFMQIELTAADPMTMTTLAAEPTGVGVLADHVNGDPRSSPRVRDLLAPHFDLENEMRGVVRSGGQMVAACGLYRAPGRRGFSPDEVMALSSLEAFIAHGVRHAHDVTRLERADHRSDGPGPSVMIFDGDGHLSEMTPVARERAALLGPESTTGVPDAVRMVAAACRSLQDGHAVSPMARIRGLDGRWYVVSGAPLDDGPAPGRSVVTIEPADTLRTLDLDLALHGLTTREAAVVREVVAGSSSTTIARTLDISAHTVQDHLKSVFSKLNVTSRRELVAGLTGNAAFSDSGGQHP